LAGDSTEGSGISIASCSDINRQEIRQEKIVVVLKPYPSNGTAIPQHPSRSTHVTRNINELLSPYDRYSLHSYRLRGYLSILHNVIAGLQVQGESTGTDSQLASEGTIVSYKTTSQNSQ
jgi:hypothetical protein